MGVRVEPRSNNAIAAGLSSFTGTSHHQKLDLARHPEKATPTSTTLRPKDRPLVNDFLPEAEFAELLRKWFGNMSRALLPGRGFLSWGGYGNLGNYPPALAESGLYFSQGIVWNKCHPVLTRKDFMVPSRLPSTAGRKVPRISSSARTTRPICGDQEGQPAVDGASHGEARRARRACDPVQLASGRERARPVRRLR